MTMQANCEVAYSELLHVNPVIKLWRKLSQIMPFIFLDLQVLQSCRDSLLYGLRICWGWEMLFKFEIPKVMP